jgi:hypothetical protein
VAAEMRAEVYAHSVLAIEEMERPCPKASHEEKIKNR